MTRHLNAWRTVVICIGLSCAAAALFIAPETWASTVGLLLICSIPVIVAAACLYLVQMSADAGHMQRYAATRLRLALLAQSVITIPMGLVMAGSLMSAGSDWIAFTMIIAASVIGVCGILLGACLTFNALNAVLSLLAGLFSLAASVGMAVIYVLSPALTAVIAAVYAGILISSMLLFSAYLSSIREEKPEQSHTHELKAAA